MSPIDPRTLQAFAERAVYVNDPKCGTCGYSLEGLPVGTRCPECGTPTRRTRALRRFGDSLTDAPSAYLRSLAFGLVLMAVTGAACMGCYGLGMVLPFGGLFAAVAGAAWWWGVYIVTAPRQVTGRTSIDPSAEHRRLRVVNRVTQGAWAVAGLLEAALFMFGGGLAGAATGPPMGVDAVEFYGLALCLAVGLLGLGPLSAQLSDLAEWANESNLAGRLRGIALIVTVCGAYIAVAAMVIGATQSVGAMTMVRGALALPLVFAWPLMVLALLLFFFTLFQMSQMTGWAIANAASADRRTERLRDRHDRARAQADAERAAGLHVDPPQDARAP